MSYAVCHQTVVQYNDKQPRAVVSERFGVRADWWLQPSVGSLIFDYLNSVEYTQHILKQLIVGVKRELTVP